MGEVITTPPKKCTPSAGLTPIPGGTGWDRPERVPRRPGRRRRRREHPGQRDSSPARLIPAATGAPPPLAGTRGARHRPQARSRGPRAAGDDPDPGARRGDAARSRGARPPSRGQRRRGARAEEGREGGPPPSPRCPPDLPPRTAGRAALTCARTRAVAAAAPPGKGRSAARPPGARRGEERGAKGEGRGGRATSVPGPRPGGGPGWTRQLLGPAAGQPVTPGSPGRRGSGSGNQPPGGAAARAAGGGGGGAGPRGRRPAHPEVVVAAAARARARARRLSSTAAAQPCAPGCLSHGERRAAGGAGLRPPCPASRDAGTPPDGGGRGPGGLEAGPPGPPPGPGMGTGARIRSRLHLPWPPPNCPA